jgi:hypothetical protein
MNLYSLRTITWGTVTAAVVSALALAGLESSVPEGRRAADKNSAAFALPPEPTGAGPQRNSTADANTRKTAAPQADRSAAR